MPAQPRKQVVNGEAEDQDRPFEPPHRAVHRLRIHAYAVGIQVVAQFLALELKLTVGLADAGHLLPTTERMHVQRQALDGRLVKPRMPCWHHTHPWGTDLCDDGVPTVAIDVHTRRQSRRSLLAIALPASP